MKTYELTYIISSQSIANEVNETANNILLAIKNRDGVVLKSERTVPQTFSYPMKGQGSGYFLTTEFQMTEDNIKELLEAVRQDKRIIRSLVIVRKPMKPLTRRRSPLLAPKIELSTPFSTTQETIAQHPQISHVQENMDKKKVDAETIEKRLDEILGE